MDRSDDFIYLCKKYDKNIIFTRRVLKCKDEFLIKGSEIYTKLFSNCDYIDNNTLQKYGLFFGTNSSSSSINSNNSSSISSYSNSYGKEKRTRIKNKDNLLYSVNKISEEIKLFKPKKEIHKYVLNCLSNLLNIFIDIVNKHENNLSSYYLKLNKYTNLYFYDVKSIKCDFCCLNRLNNHIYSSNLYDKNLKKYKDDFDFSIQVSSNKEQINYNISKSISNNMGHINDHRKNTSTNSWDCNTKCSNNETLFEDNTKNAINTNNGDKDRLKSNLIPTNENKNTNLRRRKDKKVTFDMYSYVEEEEEKKKRENMHNNGVFQDNFTSNDINYHSNNYSCNNSQTLEFKKYVDLFEKEENTYIMETKKKIAKISNLMNIFVNKIYEQNENLKMIEHIVEESIENVSQGNTYLNKIQNKKSMNSLIFFVLICTSIFLFLFDFFR
ncbi:syntaxin [Plasmodium brasilianum]|uniref:Qa-SNARE protein, putative n=2 Tax=Plasmodium (Plasmodium) TaxID=418103 RepID=A0A1A8X1L2_PLAMA|nr:syntaxin, Qa-SNARE family, putative [Plasmodium malariae]KAI4836504.1 syntaxin [Plasmodium brasilianum]SBS99117.1 Qa-SNARE protein, putative [Plasmodium malariae]SCO93780.1 syntaxin, Qa-SNARE family, putative [Plasmodium malariae]